MEHQLCILEVMPLTQLLNLKVSDISYLTIVLMIQPVLNLMLVIIWIGLTLLSLSGINGMEQHLLKNKLENK